MRYRFHPDAEREHLESIAYYESRERGLGASYLTSFESAMEQVCIAPYRYPVVRRPDVRRVLLKRFPYAVLFREVDGVVQILAVAHPSTSSRLLGREAMRSKSAQIFTIAKQWGLASCAFFCADGAAQEARPDPIAF